jgi:hypothetical protein
VSALAPGTLIVNQGSGPESGLDAASEIKKRISRGRENRRQYEPTWHSNLAFASGKHWLEWNRTTRQLVLPEELKEKELYTADVIGEYRTTALAELGSDDDRPELLLRREDLPSEDYQQQLNKAVSFGWDNEWDGDAALGEVDRLTIDLGTSAIRCRWDPTYGPSMGEFPHDRATGQPILDPDQQQEAFENGPTDEIEMRTIKQGRVVWDVLSPFNMIVPPGIPHERDFPWLVIVRPVLLSKVQEEYGEAAAALKEDTDIGSVYGWSTTGIGAGSLTPNTSAYGSGAPDRLRDHVWLFTYLENPTGQYPDGRTVTLATNQYVPLRFDDRLPYVGPDGTPRNGVSFFHWWRVSGRFWSRGLVEVMKDGQRAINKRRTQINEIIDRGMPAVFVQRDSEALNRKGLPAEYVELAPDERAPIVSQGVQPGAWLQGDVEALREDLTHATGIKGSSLGENPANVSTYSQLALINENDQAKRQTIFRERAAAIRHLVEDSVYDIRTYWGAARQIMLDGDSDHIDSAVFNATKIPPFFIVRVPKGSAKPRSQAAELQKIEDVMRVSIEAGQPLPIDWFAKSLDDGQMLPLPSEDADAQVEKATLENHMLLQGEDVTVDYFDPPQTHIPIHRLAEIQAKLSGDMAAFQRIEAHVQQHLQAGIANAQQVSAQMQPGGAPGQPPGVAVPAPGAPPVEGPGSTAPFPGRPPYGQRLNRTI